MLAPFVNEKGHRMLKGLIDTGTGPSIIGITSWNTPGLSEDKLQSKHKILIEHLWFRHVCHLQFGTKRFGDFLRHSERPPSRRFHLGQDVDPHSRWPIGPRPEDLDDPNA